MPPKDHAPESTNHSIISSMTNHILNCTVCRTFVLPKTSFIYFLFGYDFQIQIEHTWTGKKVKYTKAILKMEVPGKGFEQ